MPIQTLISIQKRNADGSAVIRPDGTPNIGIAVDPRKAYTRGYWCVPDSNPIVVPGGAGTGQAMARFLIDSKGHFDWVYLMGSFPDSPVMLDITDQQSNRQLQNKPIHSTCIVGSARRPFRLPRNYFLNVGDSQREVTIRLINLSAQTASVYLYLYGTRFYHHEAPADLAADYVRRNDYGRKDYSYFMAPWEYGQNGVPTALGANASTTFTFDQDDNADMEIRKFMMTSTGAFTYELEERDTRRTIMTGRIHSANGWGNAEFPFYPGDTYLLQRKKQLLLKVTDISGSENSIFATLGGIRFQYR